MGDGSLVRCAYRDDCGACADYRKTSKPDKSGKTPGVSYASDYVVFIDVNPSVRLDVSGGDVVTAQKGMNKDGVVLLYQENLVGKNIDEAATYLIEKMDEAGLVKDKGKVRISVADKKRASASTKNSVTP